MKTRFLILALLLSAHDVYAIDSYRYLHVTIETPWSIFLFLLGFIFLPFILMGVLSWYFSNRKRASKESAEAPHDHS
jgi:hypothetical protein